jgi:hypothetical protein
MVPSMAQFVMSPSGAPAESEPIFRNGEMTIDLVDFEAGMLRHEECLVESQTLRH